MKTNKPIEDVVEEFRERFALKTTFFDLKENKDVVTQIDDFLTKSLTSLVERDTKEIKLSHNKVALVDAEDFDWLDQWRWTAHFNKDSLLTYAVRLEPNEETGKRTRINMHREVIHAPKGVMTDHINLNTLDNRRSNLRLATPSDNAHNTRLPRNNTTGYRGVSKHSNNYVAHINKDNKYHYLGYFSDPKEAAFAYNKAAIELHGEFASLNKI